MRADHDAGGATLESLGGEHVSGATAADVVVMPAGDMASEALALGPAPAVKRIGQSVAELPVAAAARLTTVAGLAAHGITVAAESSGRWVKLTKESAEQLARLGPTTDANGVSMAVLRNTDGRFAHVLRFESLGVAPAAAASLVSGLAVQLALARIERSLQALTERVDLLIEGSQIEMEAELAAAVAVLDRVERRVGERATIDHVDWVSLAGVEGPIRAVYHQTVRWLDPLRDFLVDDPSRLVAEVRALKANVGLRDIGFWLRMYVHGELTMKRWERMYLRHELDTAADRFPAEAALLAEQARERHRTLLGLHDAMAAYLDGGRTSTGRLDPIRLISRARLRGLRGDLAVAANAYATALGIEQAGRSAPLAERAAGSPARERVLGASARATARAALESGGAAARAAGSWITDDPVARLRVLRRSQRGTSGEAAESPRSTDFE